MLGDTLLGRKHSVSSAERTLKIAFSAMRRGDRRLASSRAVTAAVQASIASVGANALTVKRAEKVVFEARRIIQSLVISRAARLGHYMRLLA